MRYSFEVRMVLIHGTGKGVRGTVEYFMITAHNLLEGTEGFHEKIKLR
jgi:hypothetical protein